MDELESKVETEVMEFKKEKAIMKQIKSLKKQFNEVKDVSDIWDKGSKLSKEIDVLKAKADSLHKIVRGHAKDSQDKNDPSNNKQDWHHRKVENAKEGIFFGEVRDEVKDNQCHNEHKYYSSGPCQPVIKNLT